MAADFLARYRTPLGLLAAIALSIFFTEALVMVVLDRLPLLDPAIEALLDATLLVLFLAPMLYLFVFRPLMLGVRETNAAAEEMRRQRDRAQMYLDIAGVMMLVVGVDGRITLINRRGAEILGGKEADLVGASWPGSFVPDGQARREALEALSSSLAGMSGYYEGTVVTAGGEERVIMWHNSPLAENGRVTGMLASGDDITDIRRAEKALLESETRLRLIHDTAFDGIVLADASGRVVDCNPSAERVFGYQPGGMRGRGLVDLMPEPYRARHLDALDHFMRTGESRVQGKVLELEGLRRDGTVFPIELMLSSFRVGGALHFTGMVRDVTERRRAEDEKEAMRAQLTAGQRMEAIGRLAGGIAHDFNNILNSIGGNAELALEETLDDHPAYKRLVEIRNSVTHASKLTRQLLLLSRGHPFEMTALDINATVEGLVGILKRLMGEGIEIETRLAGDLWPLRADESTLEQVILNLAVNARDAMPGGGRIIIKTENAFLDGIAPRAKAVRLSVCDTGVGMARETVEHIFEPFFTTKGEGKGMGLGLSVVYAIVKNHGGAIRVESFPGKGSCFMISLPVSDEPIVKGHARLSSEIV